MESRPKVSKIVMNFAGKFLRNTGGNVAVMFGLSAFVLVGAAGMAVDYGRQTKLHATLQSAADAAAVGAASSGLEDTGRKELAKNLFTRNLTTKSFSGEPLIDVDLTDLSKVIVSVDVTFKPYFMSVLGFNNVPVKVQSVVGRASTAVEIALVLDVSGSMQISMGSQTRIKALKSAAKELTDIITKNSDSKIGIVPFTMNVNVNVGTANQSFITGYDHSLFTGTT